MRSKHSSKQFSGLIRLVSLLCIFILIAGGVYIVCWQINRNRILNESEKYASLYQPTLPTLPPASAAMPEVDDVPLPTPNADTIVYALETPAPIQQSFNDLLSLNPDTVGFLTVGDLVSLPVVQSLNDNDYYLNHSFSQEERSEGSLFLDGFNRLVPEDDCLIIYGHNMQNGTMFGKLKQLLGNESLDETTVSFDTIYENRRYVPFAIFTASMDSSSKHYFDVRRFVFDEQEFNQFVHKLQSLSVYHSSLDIQYGDKLLLLVTCDYNDEDGRLILALRQLREDESL